MQKTKEAVRGHRAKNIGTKTVELEMDTIEYNYDHYFSNRYLDVLKQHE